MGDFSIMFLDINIIMILLHIGLGIFGDFFHSKSILKIYGKENNGKNDRFVIGSRDVKIILQKSWEIFGTNGTNLF
jgi:hypothetical protein